jgi:predicted Zn-dependent protease
LIDSSKAQADDLNQYAWTALFMPNVGPEAIEAADHANTMTQKRSFAILHTLGCLYAETGQEKQAREVLLAAMDSAGLDEPNSEVWYGFGRIAEQLGEFEAAKAAYARVDKPEYIFPGATYLLSQRRTEVISAANANVIKSGK